MLGRAMRGVKKGGGYLGRSIRNSELYAVLFSQCPLPELTMTNAPKVQIEASMGHACVCYFACILASTKQHLTLSLCVNTVIVTRRLSGL
jgi:hypothetical protein